VYLAFQYFRTNGQGADGTLPQVEVNYGAVPDLQLHAIVPMAWTSPESGGFQYGPGDIELGAKFRFVQDDDWGPQIGTFPLLEVLVGNASRGLGTGHVQVLLPIWLQKSFGRWTTYGGVGYWIGNPGPGGTVPGSSDGRPSTSSRNGQPPEPRSTTAWPGRMAVPRTLASTWEWSST